MSSLVKISVVIGTRPEAIKLSPLIIKFRDNSNVLCRVILTGQHQEMVKQVINLFNIEVDKNFSLMEKNQTLNHITSEVINSLGDELKINTPDLLLVQGDTTTAFASTLAAFYQKIPVGHVEAGLRTDNINDPFPEEANRRLISQLASLHFCPTKLSKLNLEKSKVTGKIFITGNTVIDALLMTASKKNEQIINRLEINNKKFILATIHRRENWGNNLISIAKGLLKIANSEPEICIVLPMHRNSIVRDPLMSILGKHPRIKLIEPLEYGELIQIMKKCTIIITDSGGLQEEAPSLGKPVLIVRKTTERQEAIDSGTAKIVGTDSENIFKEAQLLLNDKQEYRKMSLKINPFGDGKSSDRIAKHCLSFILNK